MSLIPPLAGGLSQPQISFTKVWISSCGKRSHPKTGFRSKRTIWGDTLSLTGCHLRPATFSRPGCLSRLRCPNWAFARFGHCQYLCGVSLWVIGVPSVSPGHCQFLLGSIWFIGIPSIMPVASGVCSIVPSWDAAPRRAFPHRFLVLAHASAFGDGTVRQRRHCI